MTPITFDFESFWSTEFSLSKISFMEYIKSPDFEVISVAIKIGNAPTEVYFGDDVEAAIKSIDWSDAAAIAHNGNEFDHPLLVWKYDVHPKLFVDTLALSKAQFQSEVGGSLKKLSEHFGLPEKDNTALLNTKGRRLKDFTPPEVAAMRQYNKIDTDNCYALFQAFKDGPATGDDLRQVAKAAVWNKKELLLSDMTARMIIYPQFVADDMLLQRSLNAAQIAKEATLLNVAATLGVLTTEEAKTELSSAAKCADALRMLGVEPPTKISKKTGKEALAMAKTDEEFTALLEHDNPDVQAVVAARLDVKSTILETRLAKMLKCAEAMGGWMPVPLAYHSATTGRWGGRVWNPQNLPRINPKVNKLTDSLRKSLCAPEGYKVVVSDLSGIELRVNHYLWDVRSTQTLYDNDPKADLYQEFAAALFGIDKSQVTKDQRQLAKVAQLGLGFGAGWPTFKKVAKLMGGINLDDAEAERVTLAWRAKYIDIVQGWRSCQRAIEAMHIGAQLSPDPRGLCTTDKHSIWLPSGRKLYYPNLHIESDVDTGKPQFIYGLGRGRSKVYSGLMDENLVQAIARDVIAEQALKVKHLTGYTPALMVHDELVYVVPEDKAESHLKLLDSVMRTPPTWLPGIVLWSEGDIAVNYGEAKG
jgi:DNA polymerase